MFASYPFPRLKVCVCTRMRVCMYMYLHTCINSSILLLFTQVSCGLLFLHQHDPQILHRDVTTKNILLNEDGSVVKISDLGQAKYRPSSIQCLTTTAPGCVLYMPPECLGRNPHFTDKSDTFSFGVVMLEVSTQEPPSCELNEGIRSSRARDLARLSEDHPLKPLIVHCLNEDPDKRPDMMEAYSTICTMKDCQITGLEGHEVSFIQFITYSSQAYISHPVTAMVIYGYCYLSLFNLGKPIARRLLY